jgi:hypothetical protein
MEESEVDPLLVTYVIEEAFGENGEWYSTIEAAELSALASTVWLLERIDRYPRNFQPWIEGGFRKHLRRAKPAQFEKLIAEVPGLVIPGPYGRLFASEIHSKSETNKLLSKLQLSGFKAEEKPLSNSDAAPVEIILNEALGMSFGKAVIASAHAAQQLALSFMGEQFEDLNVWSDAGYSTAVRFGTPSPSSVKYALIEDHGLTEVPAGSITALAQLR